MYVTTRNGLPGSKRDRRRSSSESADILSVSQMDGKFGGILRCQGCASVHGYCTIAFNRSSQDEVERVARGVMRGCEFNSGMYNVAAAQVAAGVSGLANARSSALQS